MLPRCGGSGKSGQDSLSYHNFLISNRMKSIYKIVLSVIGAGGLFLASCSNDAELRDPEDLVNPNLSEAYYQSLRAYKKTDHPVAFGWFGNWVGSGASLENSLRGLPDSVDFVSIWGNWRNLSQDQKNDLAYVQQVKGTRALMCFIVANVGDQLTPSGEDGKTFWGYTDNDTASLHNAIRKYANAICDTIDKYGYDGFDFDYEPHYGSPGNIAGQPDEEEVFIEALSKRIGPKSGTGKMLVIDGEPQSIAPKTGPCFNYFIVQAYQCRGDQDLDYRLSSTIDNFDGILSAEDVAKKYIVTENFENYASTGGYEGYYDRMGNKMPSLKGMALWQPVVNGKNVQKGGVGTYHMEYEYNAGKQPSYPALRQAIQIMNPAIH